MASTFVPRAKVLCPTCGRQIAKGALSRHLAAEATLQRRRTYPARTDKALHAAHEQFSLLLLGCVFCKNELQEAGQS